MCFMKGVIAALMDIHKIVRLFSFLYKKTGQLTFSPNKNCTPEVPYFPRALAVMILVLWLNCVFIVVIHTDTFGG